MDILHADIYGPDDVPLVPVVFQGVARGEGDFPVAADGVLDGVVLAGKLGSLRRVGEGEDFLSLRGMAYCNTCCVVCVLCGGKGMLVIET